MAAKKKIAKKKASKRAVAKKAPKKSAKKKTARNEVEEKAKKILGFLESRSLDEIQVGLLLLESDGGPKLFNVIWKELSKPFKMVGGGPGPKAKKVPCFGYEATLLAGEADYARRIAMMGFLNVAPSNSSAGT